MDPGDATSRQALDDGSIDHLIQPLNNPRFAATSSPSQSSSGSHTPLSESTQPATEVTKSPRHKSPTPLERFWKQARTLRTPDNFPPPTWFESEKSSINTDSVFMYKSDQSVINVAGEPESGAVTTVMEENKPELSPPTLAHRIQAIISTAPSGSDSNIQPRTPTSVLSPLADSKLMSFISSPIMVKGSPMRGSQTFSSLLGKLQSPVQNHTPDLEPREDNILDSVPRNSNGDEFCEYGDDGSSMMLCSPLIPQRDSLVELADTEYVSFDEFSRIAAQDHRSPLCQEHTIPEEQELQDPDQTSETGPEIEVQPRPDEDRPTNEEGQMEGQRPVEGQPRSTGFQWPWSKSKEQKSDGQKPKEKRVWVPSTTKISLQTTWWGYRIYLPPPVLQVLNDKQLEAAKRAAILTTALKWLLDNIPVDVLPPQFHIALKLIRSLVPLLGYIGGFIAWSWSAITRFDHGHGVTLTATWLFPIALVPGTWQAFEVPASRTPDSPPASEAANDNQNSDPRPASGAEQPSSALTSDAMESSASPREETAVFPTDASYYSSSASTSTPLKDSTEEYSTYEQTTRTMVYEGPDFNAVDTTSAYHEPIPQACDGAHYQVRQHLNIESMGLYMPQVAFLPPPVVVQTVPLPPSTPPP